jgi:hypothetical protein
MNLLTLLRAQMNSFVLAAVSADGVELVMIGKSLDAVMQCVITLPLVLEWCSIEKFRFESRVCVRSFQLALFA